MSEPRRPSFGWFKNPSSTEPDDLLRARRTAQMVDFGPRQWPWWLHRQQGATSAWHGGGDLALVENATGRRWTSVGDLGGVAATVDPAGLLVPTDTSWSLDWAISAEDRWYFAASEASIRQRLIGDGPVTETVMRIPGGDVIQRVAAFGGHGSELVVEFENDSPTPVGLALAVRPVVVLGAGSIESVEATTEGLTVDGSHVSFSRPAGAVVAARYDDVDVWDDLVNASAGSSPARVQHGDGWASAAVVIPLAHRSTVKVVVARQGTLLSTPESAPEAVDAANGWDSVIARAAAIGGPDEVLVTAWRRGVAAMIAAAGSQYLSAQDAACVAVALDSAGLPDEADRARRNVIAVLEHDVVEPEAAVQALRALASRRLRSGRESVLDWWAGALVEQAGDRLDRATLSSVIAALRVDHPDAAGDAERIDPVAVPSQPPSIVGDDGWPIGEVIIDVAELLNDPDPHTLAARVSAVATVAHDTGSLPDRVHRTSRHGLAGSGDSVTARASLLAAIVQMMVEVDEDGVVSLLPVFPEHWRGAPVDVRGLVTEVGVVSFSVRWHGARPALLWEVNAVNDELAAPIAIRCPGLDPEWSTNQASGEALLAEPAS